jgi:hypothetical protein
LVAALRSASVAFLPLTLVRGEEREGERRFGFYEPNRPAAGAEAGAEKGAKQMDVYAIVTEKIIDLLEQGVIPLRRPWAAAGLPRNLVSKKPYRGVNHFLLSASKFVSPFWLTMRQANQVGGHVRKGEKSTIVVLWT